MADRNGLWRERAKALILNGATPRQTRDALLKQGMDMATGLTLNSIQMLRKRLAPRVVADASSFIPWVHLPDNHKMLYAPKMLRLMARQAQGLSITIDQEGAIERMCASLKAKDEVWAYNPKAKYARNAFKRVPRRYYISGGQTLPVDTGWTRDPKKDDNNNDI